MTSESKRRRLFTSPEQGVGYAAAATLSSEPAAEGGSKSGPCLSVTAVVPSRHHKRQVGIAFSTSDVLCGRSACLLMVPFHVRNPFVKKQGNIMARSGQ